MLVCPRTSLLRAFGRLGMLGVAGKELDMQMSPDNLLTWYLPEVAIFHRYLEACFHQSADTSPQGSAG